MKGFIIGFVVGIIVLVAAGYFYFASGMAPVAVTDPLMPFERKMANKALDAHIDAAHVGKSPIPADEPNLLAGADVYQKNCAVCHGLPDHPVDYVNMMFPKPTQLFKGKGVTDDPPSESYWKVVNGIRLSGMPTFKEKITDTQAWQVAELVAHANELPASVKQALQPQTSASAATPMQTPPAASHK